MKILYNEICDFLEEHYSYMTSPMDWPQLWINVLICLKSGNYRIERDSEGKLLTYQSWKLSGTEIWIEDDVTLNKNQGIRNLIKELKSRYKGKGFKTVSYRHKDKDIKTFNIERHLNV